MLTGNIILYGTNFTNVHWFDSRLLKIPTLHFNMRMYHRPIFSTHKMVCPQYRVHVNSITARYLFYKSKASILQSLVTQHTIRSCLWKESRKFTDVWIKYDWALPVRNHAKQWFRCVLLINPGKLVASYELNPRSHHCNRAYPNSVHTLTAYFRGTQENSMHAIFQHIRDDGWQQFYVLRNLQLNY
jgi:hypothetical protein